MTTYVTEVQENREPPELQVLHKHPIQEPQVKAEAAQLAGKDGPRPDQNHPREEPTMSTATTWAPTREELDQATARTAKTIDSGAPLAERERAAELEESVHHGYLQRSGADAELQREAEAEWEKEAGS